MPRMGLISEIVESLDVRLAMPVGKELQKD
jgi:hypothetical protein